MGGNLSILLLVQLTVYFLVLFCVRATSQAMAVQGAQNANTAVSSGVASVGGPPPPGGGLLNNMGNTSTAGYVVLWQL